MVSSCKWRAERGGDIIHQPPTIMKKIKTYHKPQIEIISIPTIRIMTASCEMRPGHGYGDKNHGHTKNRWEEDYGEDYDNNDFNKINYNVWQ